VKAPGDNGEVKVPILFGVKAGVCVGFVWGIIRAAIEVITSRGVVSNSVGGFAFLLGIVGAIVLALFGMLFVKLEGALPGRSMIVKGMVFMMLFWMIGVFVFGFLAGRPIPNLSELLTLISDTSAGAGLGFFMRRFLR
jgi:hypothetical protein